MVKATFCYDLQALPRTKKGAPGCFVTFATHPFILREIMMPNTQRRGQDTKHKKRL